MTTVLERERGRLQNSLRAPIFGASELVHVMAWSWAGHGVALDNTINDQNTAVYPFWF